MNSDIDLLKFRSGIYYSDKVMDAAIESEIAACEAYLKKAGVPDEQLHSTIADTIKVLWIKKTQDMEAKSIVIDPAFIALVGQLRAGGDDNN